MKHRNFTLSLCLFLLGLFSVQSQTQDKSLSIPTPEAASLGLYGSVPTNNFTGLPNIQVPLYTLEDGGLKIPITMSYHAGSLKVNERPGWTGLGWTLSAGGAITRTVKGIEDERALISHLSGYGYNINLLNPQTYQGAFAGKTWYDNSLFDLYYTGLGSTHQIDVSADEFNFNFLGYSGSFYLNHTGQWVVKSDQNVKIIFENTGKGFARSYQELRTPFYFRALNDGGAQQTMFFNEFTIVTDDGTKYTFGGKYATEYSVDYQLQYQGGVIPNTWRLSKITTTTGEVIEFDYDRSQELNWPYINTTIGHQYYYERTTRGKPPGAGNWGVPPVATCSYSARWITFQDESVSGFLQFPAYLKKITSKNAVIEFGISENSSKQLNYNNDFEYWPNITSEVPHIYASGEDIRVQVDAITVSNKNGNLIKKIAFNYTNSPETRLKLKSIEDLGNGKTKSQKYSFDYNPANMPYFNSDQVDHWGFYNGSGTNKFVFNTSSPAATIDNYYQSREPNLTGVSYKAEVLEKITYPTGGYTIFDYESHNYRQVVNKERNGLISYSENKIAGGLRIKEIRSYDGINPSPNTKRYLYVKGYTGGDPSVLPSSGILNGFSQYKWFGYVGTDGQGAKVGYDIFSSNSLLENAFNSYGSHIGYSEVVEVENGNGYTINKYTNYDQDEHGFTHMDEQPIAEYNINNDPNEVDESIYFPITSLSLERGKLTSSRSFNQNNVKIKEDKYFYEKSSSEYLRCIYQRIKNICDEKTASAHVYFANAHKEYLYDYNLIKKESRVFDVNGLKPFETVNNYYYTNNVNNPLAITNQINSVIQEKTKNSEEKEQIITYKYPFDFVSAINDPTILSQSVAAKMVNAYVVSPVIKKEVTVDGNFHSKQATSYKDWDLNRDGTPDGIFLPEFIQTAKASNSFDNQFQYYNYSVNGRPQEISKKNDSHTYYVWGYQNEYPIAKIENFTETQAAAIFTTLLNPAITASNNDVSAASENTLRLKLNDIRNNSALSKAMVTTYTYDPLVGITSITDSKGYTTFYEYDEFNRLKQTKDADGKILSKNVYHYKN